MGIGKLRGAHGLSAKVLKAMGLFGGVQGVGILCSVVRVKLVALWLGPGEWRCSAFSTVPLTW